MSSLNSSVDVRHGGRPVLPEFPYPLSWYSDATDLSRTYGNLVP